MLSFERVHRAYAPDVLRFALWMTGNPAQADDIASETFVRAWTKREKIRAETLKAYFLTIPRPTLIPEGGILCLGASPDSDGHRLS
jgi:DNA-directed RNA polymerase specialized sigma24 family protein